MRRKKGQNIIEYILLAVAAILVFLVILKPKSGPLNDSVNRTLNTTLKLMGQADQSIKF